MVVFTQTFGRQRYGSAYATADMAELGGICHHSTLLRRCGTRTCAISATSGLRCASTWICAALSGETTLPGCFAWSASWRRAGSGGRRGNWRHGRRRRKGCCYRCGRRWGCRCVTACNGPRLRRLLLNDLWGTAHEQTICPDIDRRRPGRVHGGSARACRTIRPACALPVCPTGLSGG
jgi:hypothetical protein